MMKDFFANMLTKKRVKIVTVASMNAHILNRHLSEEPTEGFIFRNNDVGIADMNTYAAKSLCCRLAC